MAAEPKALDGVIQAAIDKVVASKTDLALDPVILNDALLLALEDFDGTWVESASGKDSFIAVHEDPERAGRAFLGE